MIEPLFGMPSTPFGFQPPIAIASRPMATSFGSSTLAGIPGGMAGAQPASVPGAFPFANNPAAFFGPIVTDPAGGMTAPLLIAAVAMRRGQPHGPTNDQEVEDFIYDAFEVFPGVADVEVRCEGGRVTLTGSVQHKRLKRDVGEIAWAIPVLHDVQNNVTITSRRRTRSGSSRETEVPAAAVNRKQG
jgi:hypothetical protein